MTLRRDAEAVLFAYPVLGHLVILSSNSSVAKRHILRTYPADTRRVIAVCSEPVSICRTDDTRTRV